MAFLYLFSKKVTWVQLKGDFISVDKIPPEEPTDAEVCGVPTVQVLPDFFVHHFIVKVLD